MGIGLVLDLVGPPEGLLPHDVTAMRDGDGQRRDGSLVYFTHKEVANFLEARVQPGGIGGNLCAGAIGPDRNAETKDEETRGYRCGSGSSHGTPSRWKKAAMRGGRAGTLTLWAEVSEPANAELGWNMPKHTVTLPDHCRLGVGVNDSVLSLLRASEVVPWAPYCRTSW